MSSQLSVVTVLLLVFGATLGNETDIWADYIEDENQALSNRSKIISVSIKYKHGTTAERYHWYRLLFYCFRRRMARELRNLLSCFFSFLVRVLLPHDTVPPHSIVFR